MSFSIGSQPTAEGQVQRGVTFSLSAGPYSMLKASLSKHQQYLGMPLSVELLLST